MKKLLFLLTFCTLQSVYAQKTPPPLLTPEEYYTSAMSYKNKDNYTEAWRLLSKALAQEPDNWTYKKAMAEIQYVRKAFFEAIPLYEEMVEKEGGELIYLARLAEMYSMSPKKMKGVEYADKVVKMKPENGEILKMIGRTYYEVHHFPKAVKQYEEAEKLLPEDKDIPFKIAYCYQQMNNYKDAMIFYEKALALDPENPAKMFETANSCYDANNYNRAIELYQLAETKGYFKSKMFYDNWALTYFEMKDYDNAIAYYMKAKEYAPYDKDINLSIAETYIKKGDFGKSREILDELLEANPDDAEVIYTKGMTYYKAGNTSKAEQFFNRAFELDPSLKSLRYTKVSF